MGRNRYHRDIESLRAGTVLGIPIGAGQFVPAVVLAVKLPMIATASLDYVVEIGALPEATSYCANSVDQLFLHGPLGLKRGWVVLGEVKGFDRSEWPELRFFERHLNRVIELDDESLEERRITTTVTDQSGLSVYGISGPGFIEEVLARRFSSKLHEE